MIRASRTKPRMGGKGGKMTRAILSAKGKGSSRA